MKIHVEERDIFKNTSSHLCGYNTTSAHCHRCCVKHQLDLDIRVSLFSLWQYHPLGITNRFWY